MTPAAIFLALIPPPLPPTGPVTGNIECLFGPADEAEAGWVEFNEGGLGLSVLSVPGKGYGPQVRMIRVPVDESISDIEFGGDRSITIHGQPGQRVLGKFGPLTAASNSSLWMDFSIPASSEGWKVVGRCIADIRGRLERPVRLTKIMTLRVDKVP